MIGIFLTQIGGLKLNKKKNIKNFNLNIINKDSNDMKKALNDIIRMLDDCKINHKSSFMLQKITGGIKRLKLDIKDRCDGCERCRKILKKFPSDKKLNNIGGIE